MGEPVENVPTKLFYWVFVVCFCFTALFLFMMWIFYSYGNYVSYFPRQAEEDLLFYRFVYSPNCFAYQDKDTNRVYTGIVDFEKFSSNVINNCYKAEKAIAFRLTLKDIELQTLNWKEGIAVNKKIPKQILIISNGVISKEALMVEVQYA